MGMYRDLKIPCLFIAMCYLVRSCLKQDKLCSFFSNSSLVLETFINRGTDGAPSGEMSSGLDGPPYPPTHQVWALSISASIIVTIFPPKVAPVCVLEEGTENSPCFSALLCVSQFGFLFIGILYISKICFRLIPAL